MVVKIWLNAKFLLPLHPILDDGVMVTLQVLVLSFPVRIRVVQQKRLSSGSLFLLAFVMKADNLNHRNVMRRDAKY